MNRFQDHFTDTVPVPVPVPCCSEPDVRLDHKVALSVCLSCGKCQQLIIPVESHKEKYMRLSRYIPTSVVSARDQRIYHTIRWLKKSKSIPHQLVEIFIDIYKHVDFILQGFEKRPIFHKKQLFKKIAFLNYKMNNCQLSLRCYESIPALTKKSQQRKLNEKWSMVYDKLNKNKIDLSKEITIQNMATTIINNIVNNKIITDKRFFCPASAVIDFLPNKYDKHMANFRIKRIFKKWYEKTICCGCCCETLEECHGEYSYYNYNGDGEKPICADCQADCEMCADCDILYDQEYYEQGHLNYCELCSEMSCQDCRDFIRVKYNDAKFCDNCYDCC